MITKAVVGIRLSDTLTSESLDVHFARRVQQSLSDVHRLGAYRMQVTPFLTPSGMQGFHEFTAVISQMIHRFKSAQICSNVCVCHSNGIVFYAWGSIHGVL